jgi:transposase InsO family protein
LDAGVTETSTYAAGRRPKSVEARSRGKVDAGSVEDIDHSRIKTKSPQTNGIAERFHKTVLDEFYRVAFRKKIYGSISDLQRDLDDWVKSCNEERPH